MLKFISHILYYSLDTFSAKLSKDFLKIVVKSSMQLIRSVTIVGPSNEFDHSLNLQLDSNLVIG